MLVTVDKYDPKTDKTTLSILNYEKNQPLFKFNNGKILDGLDVKNRGQIVLLNNTDKKLLKEGKEYEISGTLEWKEKCVIFTTESLREILPDGKVA